MARRRCAPSRCFCLWTSTSAACGSCRLLEGPTRSVLGPLRAGVARSSVEEVIAVALRQLVETHQERQVRGVEVRILRRRALYLGATAQIALDKLDRQIPCTSCTGRGSRARTCHSSAANWVRRSWFQRLLAKCPPSRMLTLAQPTIVSSRLRSMHSPSAPQSARIAPPERKSGCTHERPSSITFGRSGRSPGEIEFGVAVEATDAPRGCRCQYAIGADDGARVSVTSWCAHEQVLAVGVEHVDVVAGRRQGAAIVARSSPRRTRGTSTAEPGELRFHRLPKPLRSESACVARLKPAMHALEPISVVPVRASRQWASSAGIVPLSIRSQRLACCDSAATCL